MSGMVSTKWSKVFLAIIGSIVFSEFVVAEVVIKKQIVGKRAHKVVFRYQPVIAVESVHLAGTFNNWVKTSTPMKERKGSGVYEAELEMLPGKYEYKFVLNGKTWIQDQNNPESTPDGNGGMNSVVHVGRRRPTSLGLRGDGKVSGGDIIHDATSLSFASAVDNDKRLIIRLHVLKNDVKSVSIDATSGATNAFGTRKQAMRRIACLAGRDIYEARLYYPKKAPRILRYRFWLDDGAKKPFVFGKKGLGNGIRFRLVTDHAGRFETPDWVRDASFYQIFPDRFMNGDPSNDSKGLRKVEKRPKGRAWSKNDAYLESWDGKPSYFNFFGGDLVGIEQRLDYLSELGINAIYLNPIFKAYSNHRYDAADYEAVDPRLGSLEDFQRLCKKAKAKGIRIMLDAVFNHTGHRHYAFEDIVRKGPKSRYKNWYFIEKYPVRRAPKPSYKCWWDFPDLPQLDTKNPEVVRHLLDVAKKWLDLGADGWRLDVPNEVEAVNPHFWKAFRKHVRGSHPQSYILGEIWTDAAPWLNEDKFDATMNYPVRRAILDFIITGDCDAKKFNEVLSEQRARLPEAAMRVQFNLLGSHDTARIKHAARGQSDRVKLAYAFLFAYIGAPVVYYGDEIGMTGDKDPDCRRTFKWDKDEHDSNMQEWIRRLAKLRKAELSLRRGLVIPVYSEGSIHAFLRAPDDGDRGRALLIVLNASNKADKVTLPRLLKEFPKGPIADLLKVCSLSSQDAKEVVLSLPAHGFGIFASQE